MVECVTRDRRVAGSSLSGSTVTCPYPLLITGSSREDPSQHALKTVTVEQDVNNRDKLT